MRASMCSAVLRAGVHSPLPPPTHNTSPPTSAFLQNQVLCLSGVARRRDGEDTLPLVSRGLLNN